MGETSENLILVDGKLMLENEFALSLSNRSYRYGDGLFETIKVVNGKIPFYKAHYSRLVRGLDALQIEIPEYFHLDFFHQELNQLIQGNLDANAVIRYQCFRDGAGTYLPQSNALKRVAQISYDTEQELIFPNPKSQYRIGLFPEIEKPFSKISFIKSSNALIYILAAKYAQEKALDNVIIQSNGKVVETVSENIFFYKNGQVFTPPISDGPVEGIMRGVVKKLLLWNKIPLIEESIFLDQIGDFEEVFLTNSVKGIIPVSHLNGFELQNQFISGLRLKLEERTFHLVNL